MSIRKIGYFIIVFIMLWAPIQDTVLSFLFRFYPSSSLKYLLILKESLLIFALFLLIIGKFLKKFSVSWIEVYSILFILVCVFHLIFVRPEGVPLITSFTTFRAIILPILFILVGKMCKVSVNEFMFLIKVSISVSIISGIFGIVEMLVPVENFWNGQFFNLYGFLTNIKGLQEGYAGGFVKRVPANFWGFVGMRRMAGLSASPLAIGYYLILPILLLSVDLKSFKNKIYFLFLFLCLILTETRAAILATIGGLLLYFLDFKKLLKLKLNKYLVYFSLCIILLFAFLLQIEKVRNFALLSLTGKEGRIIGHIKSVQRGISNISEVLLLGKGFGTAGSWATLQGSKIGYGGESAFIDIIIQTGFLSFIFFLLWWSWIYVYLKRRFSLLITNEGTKKLGNIFKVLLCAQIVYFLTGFASEQIQAFTATHNFWLLTGVALRIKINDNYFTG